MKTSIPPVLITFALVCFALSPMLEAQNQNTKFGVQALASNTTGDQNTAIGHWTMHDNTRGSDNTATGFQALANNTVGESNTATGASVLRNNTTGSLNTANGFSALDSNTIGYYNTATGAFVLGSNTTGYKNTATGVFALRANTTGYFNTANGVFALDANTTGAGNTAIGAQALNHNTVGIYNIALGISAGKDLTTGSNNINIGVGVSGSAGEANTIRIGKQGTQMATYIAGIKGATVSGMAVFVNDNGQLGTVPSSQRFKEEIKSMDQASEAILALKPVTFHYKKEIDPEGIPQFGLVAEEVQEVNPDLVMRDREGKPYTVRYEAVNAMLLNEFLKEYQKVQDLEKQVEKLTVGLQKVSAQIEASKPSPQVVNNP